MFGEHITDVEIMAFRGLKTGVILANQEKKLKSEVVYISVRPFDEKAGLEKKCAEEIAIDSEKHLAVYDLAWEMALNPKVDIQAKNLHEKFEGLNTCYFLVNSRLHAKVSDVLIGGYIQNPQVGTKSHKLLEMIYSIWNKRLEELGQRKASKGDVEGFSPCE